MPKGFLFSTFFLAVCCLFDNSHSDRCEVTPYCGLICISLMIGGVEHLFMCFLAVYVSPLRKCLFGSSAYLSISCLFFYVKLLLDILFCGYLLPFIDGLSFLFHLFIFAFVSSARRDISKKVFLTWVSESILSVFSSKSFFVSGLTF